MLVPVLDRYVRMSETSETVSEFTDRFLQLNRRNKYYYADEYPIHDQCGICGGFLAELVTKY